MTGLPALLIDGETPTLDDLAHQALVNYGAYTSFRVEDGAVRGLDLHLVRLTESSLALFGAANSEDHMRALMRLAVAGRDACWLRVSLFSLRITPRAPSWSGAPRVMTAVSPPPPPLATSVRLQVQTHEREQPTIKHTAILGLIHARRAAREAGFDDAVFADAAGLISEGSSWNVGFLRGDTVVWPQAPMLAGVTRVLIERGLSGVGLTSTTEPVRLSDLPTFDAAFLCNAATPACAVTAIGDQVFSPARDPIPALAAAWAATPPEPI
jgi:branched-subunit amino acid aminotransferase/4-amino-4-deoxychorismate lyase